MLKKLFIALIPITIIAAFFFFDLQQYASLDYIQSVLSDWKQWVNDNLLLAIVLYFTAYIILTVASLPLALPITLLGGALFGLWLGVIIVSFASTIGATCAMLFSRYLLGDWVQKRFGDKLSTINQGIEREGNMYLLSLRLIPAFPFFVINYLIGLTKMTAKNFYWVSQLGMLPGTLVFVYLGVGLSEISSFSGLLSWKLLAAFTAIGLLPIASRWLVNKLNKSQSNSVIMTK